MNRIFVAGHGGLVGTAICRRLEAEDIETLVAGRDEVDLTDQAPGRRMVFKPVNRSGLSSRS